ncbi:MAG: hypothetical protein V1799_04725 [bacterium]
MVLSLFLVCLLSAAQPDTVKSGSRVIINKIIRDDPDPGVNPNKDSVNYYYKHPERYRGIPHKSARLFVMKKNGDTLSLKRYFRNALPDFPESLEVTISFEISWNGALRGIVEEYKGNGAGKIDFTVLFKPIRAIPAILYGFPEWEKQYLRLSRKWLLSDR